MSNSTGSNSTGGRGGIAALQVLLAVVFLAIIGGTVGFLVGEQHNSNVRQARAGNSTPATTGGGQTTDATGSSAPTGTRCPTHTEAQAGVSPLSQVLYLHTTKGSSVWICQAPDGTLYYQGHRDGSIDFTEGVNALFLRTITKQANEYVATNYNATDGSTTEYHVTPQRLVIVHLNYASPTPNFTEPAG